MSPGLIPTVSKLRANSQTLLAKVMTMLDFLYQCDKESPIRCGFGKEHKAILSKYFCKEGKTFEIERVSGDPRPKEFKVEFFNRIVLRKPENRQKCYGDAIKPDDFNLERNGEMPFCFKKVDKSDRNIRGRIRGMLDRLNEILDMAMRAGGGSVALSPINSGGSGSGSATTSVDETVAGDVTFCIERKDLMVNHTICVPAEKQSTLTLYELLQDAKKKLDSRSNGGDSNSDGSDVDKERSIFSLGWRLEKR